VVLPWLACGMWDGRGCAVGCVPMEAALTIRPLIQRELSCRKRRLRVSLTTMLAEGGRSKVADRASGRVGDGRTEAEGSAALGYEIIVIQ
jgi:hypothetical protein